MMHVTELLEKIGIARKDIKPFLIFVVGVAVASIVLVATPFFASIGPIVLIVIFGTVFSLLWFMAGYVVFRSLLIASVGLSFIIFIGQAYCALPLAKQVDDSSLMTIVGFGFIYVVAQFGRSLYRELFGDKQAIEERRQKGMIALFKEVNGNRHSWSILVTYGLLISLFIWQVYSVIKPIINGLCVYTK